MLLPRVFDHDECRRLRAEDPKRWTFKELAAHFDVSSAAVSRVLNPQTRARMDRNSLAWARRQRAPCKGGCGTLVWRHGVQGRARTGYCLRCLALQRSKSVRADTLLCTRCKQWKPDEQFPHRNDAVSRRGRATLCRPCQTIARREYRNSTPERRLRDRLQQRDYRREKKGALMATFIVLKQINETTFKKLTEMDGYSDIDVIERAATEPGTYLAFSDSRFRTVTPMTRMTVEGVRPQNRGGTRDSKPAQTRRGR
jgi:hypothetical protein